MKKNVFIQQIVVPAYRQAFFSQLARDTDCNIEVHASDTVSKQPKPSSNLAGFNYTNHRCRSIFGGRFYWQSDMNLPPQFVHGDIVVYNSNPRVLSNFRLIRQAKKRRCRIVSWNHYMSATSGRLASTIRKKLTARAADSYIVYTEEEARLMIQDGYDAKTIWPINNTINTNKIVAACTKYFPSTLVDPTPGKVVASIDFARSQSPEIADFKRANQLGPLTLLFCGRLISKSRLDQLLYALVDIMKIKPKFSLVVIGDGPELEGLMELAAKLGLQHNIQWLGSIYDEQQLAPWFLSSQLFVFPGSIGLSLNHAMAYGVPILTHDNARHHGPEFSYLQEDLNGFTFSENSVDSLANRLLSIINRPNLPQISVSGLKKIYTEITIDNMVARFINVLQNDEKLT